jgi:hypothetical protein
MSDKSPRQAMSKKASRSIKEKRSDKRDKTAGASSPVDDAPKKKR